MEERTNASEALERLAWTLNFHEDGPTSVNKIAEKTDLSWATAKKYTQLLERLSRIAPDVKNTDEGIEVRSIGKTLASLRGQKEPLLLVYLITQAENKGKSTDPIAIATHQDVLSRYEETISELREIGWVNVEEGGGTINLTPTGVAQAGQIRSQLRNTDSDRSVFGTIVTSDDTIIVGNAGRSAPWITEGQPGNTLAFAQDQEETFGTEASQDYNSENWEAV
jgi:Mn-dependent DtxR family transcriptional regulator